MTPEPSQPNRMRERESAAVLDGVQAAGRGSPIVLMAVQVVSLAV